MAMGVSEVRFRVERSSPLARRAHEETFSAFGPLQRKSCASISSSAVWTVTLVLLEKPTTQSCNAQIRRRK